MSLRCTFCFVLGWVPGWVIVNAVIGYMSEHHLFPCWGCGI